MKHPINFLIIIFSSLLLLGMGFYYEKNMTETATGDSLSVLSVATPSGFYSEDILVEITAPKQAEVYYTEDGSFPSADNANSILYEEPFTLPCYDELTVYTLKFVAYLEDSVSPV